METMQLSKLRMPTLGWSHRSWVLLFIITASAVRLVYGFAINDPMGGADADTYDAAGRVIAAHGPFAQDIPGVPYWPAGYPALVGAVYAVAGASPVAVVPVQVLLLGLGTYWAFRLVAEQIGERAGVLTALLLSASPALVAAPTVLMYEVPLSVATVAGFLVLSRTKESARPLVMAASAGLLFAVAAALQPKVLLPTLLGAGWLALTTRRLLPAALVVALSLIGPSALAARSWAANGEPLVAATLGVTMRIGMHDGADGGYQPTGAPIGRDGQELAARDRALVRDSVRWASDNPTRALALAGPKAWNFWSPLAGGGSLRGTWFHGFDPRRVLPLTGAIWTALRAIWTMATMALAASGAVLAWRRRPAGAALLLIPVMSFLVISLASIGDARFRIPVAPFYSAFIATTLVALLRERSPRADEE